MNTQIYDITHIHICIYIYMYIPRSRRRGAAWRRRDRQICIYIYRERERRDTYINICIYRQIDTYVHSCTKTHTHDFATCDSVFDLGVPLQPADLPGPPLHLSVSRNTHTQSNGGEEGGARGGAPVGPRGHRGGGGHLYYVIVWYTIVQYIIVQYIILYMNILHYHYYAYYYQQYY